MKNDYFTVQHPHLRYGARVLEAPESRFVEGHRVLSPNTRDRFIIRNTIKWSDDVEDHPWEVDDDVQAEGNVTEKVWVAHWYELANPKNPDGKMVDSKEMTKGMNNLTIGATEGDEGTTVEGTAVMERGYAAENGEDGDVHVANRLRPRKRKRVDKEAEV